MTPEEKNQVRNDTIDELCNWLDSCIASVDHNSETFKACTAMSNAMRQHKTQEVLDTKYPNEKHLPLTNKPVK
jgi:hypothetical protein